jgi:hypothetical protein
MPTRCGVREPSGFCVAVMTNGAVGDVVVTQGRTLTLRYEDGEKTVVVPENAPIISYGVGSRAMLVSGTRHHCGEHH